HGRMQSLKSTPFGSLGFLVFTAIQSTALVCASALPAAGQGSRPSEIGAVDSRFMSFDSLKIPGSSHSRLMSTFAILKPTSIAVLASIEFAALTEFADEELPPTLPKNRSTPQLVFLNCAFVLDDVDMSARLK